MGEVGRSSASGPHWWTGRHWQRLNQPEWPEQGIPRRCRGCSVNCPDAERPGAVPSAETHGCRAESGHSHRRTSLSSRARTRMARTRRNEADWCSNTFAVGAPGLSRGNPKTAGRINRGLRGCPPCLRLHRPSRSAADRNPGTPRVMGARSPAIEVFRGGKLSSATVDAPTNRRPTLANSGSGDGQRARLSRLNGNELTP